MEKTFNKLILVLVAFSALAQQNQCMIPSREEIRRETILQREYKCAWITTIAIHVIYATAAMMNLTQGFSREWNKDCPM